MPSQTYTFDGASFERSNRTVDSVSRSAELLVPWAVLEVGACRVGGGKPPANVEVDVPRRITDRYFVISRIGTGAARTIYRAFDAEVGREVAAEVMRVTDPEARRSLLERGRFVATLSHPNLVPVHDVTTVAGGEVCVVTDPAKGQTLRQWLARHCTPAEVLAVFRQVGRGLAHAHRAGIVHGDFEPDDVIVEADGTARVTNFVSAPCTEAARSLRHRAPEHRPGLDADPRVDQYAFCVALWEALVRAPLLSGASDPRSLLACKRGRRPCWSSQKDLPPSIAAALERGLEAQPQERFPSMDALLDALQVDLAVDRHRGWRLSAVVSATVVMGAVAWGLQSERAQLCAGSEQALQGVWDASRGRDVAAAMAATRSPVAHDVAARVVAELDAYANGWKNGHRLACEATKLREIEAPALLDLRMRCFQRAKVELRAAGDVLAEADALVVDNAVALVDGLPDLEPCMAKQPPAFDVPDAAHEDAVDAARVQLAAIEMLVRAGKTEQALPRARQLVVRAEQIAHGPLVAEARLELGRALAAHGDFERAAPALRAALRSALRHARWPEAHAAATELVDVLGHRQGRSEEARAYAQTAVALKSVGRHDEVPRLLEVVDAEARARRR